MASNEILSWKMLMLKRSVSRHAANTRSKYITVLLSTPSVEKCRNLKNIYSLIKWCRGQLCQNYRTSHLDRIQQVEMLAAPFEQPENFDCLVSLIGKAKQ
jgi:hypothetical protein